MKTRRDFLNQLGCAAGAAAMSGLPGAAQPAGQRQNVLFIAIDDLNDWIGCLGGYPGAKTPNLDRLAARGLLFTNAHCSAPVCNPSRASIMTGIRPSTSGVYENRQPMRKSTALQDAVTLPQHFMAHGYRAAGSGKIYHGRYPDPQSWDEYFPSQKQNKPPDPVPDQVPANGIPGTGNMDWGALENSDKDMGDWKVTDWVAGELNKKQDKPFFLACGIFKPHLPWHVPEKYFDMYPLDSITLPNVKEDDLKDVPPIGKKLALRSGDHKRVTEHKQWRQAVQAYLASLTF
ncbi:MAG: sulfatase-like hydrolase/transferase, partial [Bryobacteraceae bacterium]